MDTRERDLLQLRAEVQVGEEIADTRTQARLTAIRRRHENATGGPWTLGRLHNDGPIRISAGPVVPHIIANVVRSSPNAGADAEMLHCAHGDITFLLAEVDRLRKELHRLPVCVSCDIVLREWMRRTPVEGGGVRCGHCR